MIGKFSEREVHSREWKIAVRQPRSVQEFHFVEFFFTLQDTISYRARTIQTGTGF